MRQSQSLGPFYCGLASAVFLAGVVFLSPAAVVAGEPGQASPGCTCPGNNKLDRERLWPRPKLAEARPALDGSDETAALEAVQVALSEVGDGSTYVWQRRGGRISGLVQPTTSFKDAKGRVCRHLVITLASGAYSRKAEGIACRLDDGVWQLEG